MYSITKIVNNMLAARRNGDLVSAKFWQDQLEEVQYIY